MKDEGSSTPANSMEDDFLGDIKQNILTKIGEYHKKITEEQNLVSRTDFEAKRKKDTMELFNQINKERKELGRKHSKQKEDLEKKQLEELREFQKKSRAKQETLELSIEEKEEEVIASEAKIKKMEDIIKWQPEGHL